MAIDQETVKKDIDKEVVELITEETKLAQLEQALQESPQFKAFIQAQQDFRDKSSAYWKNVEQQMIDNGIKSVKGDWGSLTIVERVNLKAPDLTLVPAKFIKKALDTTKVSAYEKLAGELPKGVISTPTQYLMKKFKKAGEIE